MAIISIPFAFMTGNRGAMAGVGVSLGIAFAYWSVSTLFEQVGDVRASGALIGIEFVRDRASLDPAPAFHRAVHLQALRRGVLGITQWGKWVYRLQPALMMPLDLFRWSCARIAEAVEEVAVSPPPEPPSLLERGAPVEGGSRRR